MVLEYTVFGDPMTWTGQRFATHRVRTAGTAHRDAANFERPPEWPLDRQYVARVTAFVRPNAPPVDLPDLAKFALDALQGVAFTNDAQVEALDVARHIDPREPRTEVRIAIVKE
jgi:Holliday junction resolvase RusA-like endonuclease